VTKVIIPMNRLDRVKGRLDPFLTPLERRELMLATLATVVVAVSEAGLHPEVLTAAPSEFRDARIEAEFIAEDAQGGGLNGQLTRAIAGRTDVLILHADLPLATGSAVKRVLLEAIDKPGIAIVRSGDGGTNAMRLRPPGRFPLAYGANSYAMHVAAATEAGYDTRQVEAPELALDLDTEDDLRAFVAVTGWEATAAGEVLLRAGAPERLRRATEAARRRR